MWSLGCCVLAMGTATTVLGTGSESPATPRSESLGSPDDSESLSIPSPSRAFASSRFLAIRVTVPAIYRVEYRDRDRTCQIDVVFLVVSVIDLVIPVGAHHDASAAD